MSGEITYLGSRTIGDCLPIVGVTVGLTLPELQAKLAGLVELAAHLTITPPSLTANLELLAQIQATIEASIALGLPGVDFQVAAVAAAIASIEAQVGLLLAIDTALGTAGIHSYTYSGRADELGASFTAELSTGFPGGAPSDQANAVVFATTIPAAWAVLAELLGLSL